MERKDYCGPYWMPSWIRRLLSCRFNASCKIHDLDYESKKFTKEEIDCRFLENMKKQSKKNVVWKALAYVFYSMVKWFGQDSWKNASKD